MSKKFLSPIKLAQGATNPSTGSAGELFYNTGDSKIYTHNGTSWLAAGGGVTNSATAPSSPANGDAWFNTTEGTLFVYYADGTSGQWVEATSPKQGIESYQLSAGSIMAWGGATAPANWMIADGTAVSRTTYASLFAAISTTYGAGDGSTTFNLPNLKGRTIVGLDSSQTEFNTLGETGGAKTHTLTTSELPSHTHANTLSSNVVASSTHTHGSSGMVAGANLFVAGSNVYVDYNARGYSPSYYEGTRMAWYVGGTRGTVNENSTEGIGIFGNTDAASATTTVGITNASAGSDSAHNNLQPYAVLNYIIKYSAGETPGDSELAGRVGTLETQNNATPLSPNYVINGGFDIWQRGTSWSNTTGIYGPDRWKITRNGAGTNWTGSRVASSTAGFQYALRMQRTSGTTGVDPMFVGHALETAEVVKMQGKTMTISFYLRAGANLSSSVSFYLASGTGTDEQSFALLTGEVGLVSESYSLATSMTRYSKTFTVPANATSMRFNISFTPIGTAGANDYFDLTGVQLEESSYATPFRRNANSIQAELAACQRYYYRMNFTSGADAADIRAMQYNSAGGVGFLSLPVVMRTVPSSMDGSSASSFRVVYYNGSGSYSAPTLTSIGYSPSGSGPSSIFFNTGYSGTNGYVYGWLDATVVPAYLGWSAEL